MGCSVVRFGIVGEGVSMMDGREMIRMWWGGLDWHEMGMHLSRFGFDGVHSQLKVERWGGRCVWARMVFCDVLSEKCIDPCGESI